MSAPDDNDTVVVIPPAPGDVEALAVERAALTAYDARRSYTIPGGFSLDALRAAAAAPDDDDHEPFPLVRRKDQAISACPGVP